MGSIRARILLAVAVPAVLILAFSSTILYLWLRNESLSDLDRSLETRAAAMAALVELEDGEWDVDFDATDVPAAELFGGLAGYAVHVAATGRVLGTHAAPELAEHSPPWEARDLAALPGDRPLQLWGEAATVGSGDATLRTWSGLYLVRAHTGEPDVGPGGSDTLVTDADGAPPVVRIVAAQRVAPVMADLRRVLTVQLVTGLVLSALAIGAGQLLSSWIVDPIKRIANAAGNVRMPCPHPPLPPSDAGLEIEQLVGTLNDTFVRLDGAFSLQTRFTADASHELRTPVAVVRTQAEVALRRDRAPEEYRATLAAVLAGATRMQETLEALLMLTRADAGALVEVRGPVDLADLARVVVAEAEGHGLRMGVEASGDVGVQADHEQLGIALRNVVANAVRHTATPGEVVVRLYGTPTEVGVEVSDTGEGIPAEALPHVFERFFRLDQGRSRQAGGSGLGLSIVKAVVEQHGGRVEATSKVGVGTTIRFWLPRGFRVEPEFHVKGSGRASPEAPPPGPLI